MKFGPENSKTPHDSAPFKTTDRKSAVDDRLGNLIISLGYYPYSQLRNAGCYPLKKCDTGAGHNFIYGS